jgi:M-phase inducer phosphatase
MAPQIVNFDIKCDSPGKENLSEEDISFYASHSPAASPRQCHTTSPSIYVIDKNVMHCNSQDSTSMDSGYSGLHHPESNNMLSSSVESSSSSAFTFLKPKRPSENGFITASPPNQQQRTPSKYSMALNNSNRKGNGFQMFHSLSSGSMESCDDEFMELMEMENMDEDTQMPSDLKSLICKDIKNSSRTPDNKRPPSFARKCLNMDTNNSGAKSLLFGSPQTPKSSTITSLITTPERQCLGTISENITPFRGNAGGFKRPEPPSASQSPVQNKRLKCENETITSSTILKFNQSPQFPLQLQQTKRPIFRKSVSMNDAAIMSALTRSTSEPNLIGDCSQPFCLPLIEGRHTDLKSITASTMSQLLLGEFNDRVASYKVIDCRYPYEFEGGHIQGAINLYTQEQIIEELVKTKTETPTITAGDQKRHILVFHCEFSSERGPKL